MFQVLWTRCLCLFCFFCFFVSFICLLVCLFGCLLVCACLCLFVCVRVFVCLGTTTRLPCYISRKYYNRFHPENPFHCPSIWWLQASLSLESRPACSLSMFVMARKCVHQNGGDVEQVAFRLEVQQYVPGDAWFLRSFVDLLVIRWQQFIAELGCFKLMVKEWGKRNPRNGLRGLGGTFYTAHHPRLFPTTLSLVWWHGKFQSSSPEK